MHGALDGDAAASRPAQPAAQAVQGGLDVDAVLVAHRLAQLDQINAGIRFETRQQGVVGSRCPGLVQDDPVGVALLLQVDGDEYERRAHALTVKAPRERADGHVEVVRPGLRQDRAGGGRHGLQAPRALLAGEVDVDLPLLVQLRGPFLGAGRRTVLGAVRVRAQGHQVTGIDEVLEPADQIGRHPQSHRVARGAADEGVAPRQV